MIKMVNCRKCSNFDGVEGSELFEKGGRERKWVISCKEYGLVYIVSGNNVLRKMCLGYGESTGLI